MPEQALSGLKVIEFGDLVAAPYCGKLMADWVQRSSRSRHRVSVMKPEDENRLPEKRKVWKEAACLPT